MSGLPSRRAGVCGWPIAHSRSPLIHRYWLERLGVDGAYERFAVPPGAFSDFAASIGVDRLVGPMSPAAQGGRAFAACDRARRRARGAGAVNTLWREAGALCGDNTDVAGFLANLDAKRPTGARQGGTAVVLGAGGAARAVVYALLARLRPSRDRQPYGSRAPRRWRPRFGGAAEAAPWASSPRRLPARICWSTRRRSAWPGSRRWKSTSPMPDAAVVADIVYVPLRTPLIEAARRGVCAPSKGWGCCCHQAAPAFARWFGARPR